MCLQVLRDSDASTVFYCTDYNSCLLLERDLGKRLLRPYCFALRLYAEYDLVGQLCGPYVWKQTIRQVSIICHSFGSIYRVSRFRKKQNLSYISR